MSKKKMQKRSSIRGLLNNAKQGDVKSIYELARNYEVGRYVEKDIEKSKEYDNQILSKANEFDLKITQIELFQFRQFDTISVEFEGDVTILVGNNGSGKSTVLDAIALSLSWLRTNIVNVDASSPLPDKSDVNVVESSTYTYIDCHYQIVEQQQAQHILAKPKMGFKASVDSEHDQIKLLGDIYRFANQNKTDFNLPIAAYYSIGRSDEIKHIDFKKADDKANEITWHKLDGYAESVRNPQAFSKFLAWFIRIDNIRAEAKVPLGQLDMLNKDVAQLESDIKTANDGLIEYLNEQLAQKRQEINKIENELAGEQSLKCDAMLKIVIGSIGTFIPEITNIAIDHQKDGVDMRIEKSGLKISALQLSQGEKSMMALVGDLARRLTMLNPSRENPLDGNGIVLIDEIDLHLHPSWQQNVVQRLRSTFKNIQFILTTHSPQVLSTVAKANIRILGRNINDKHIAAKPLAETFAHPSSDVMQTVMKVEPVPQLPINDDINQYRDLIEQGDLKNPDVIHALIALKQELEKTLGNKHPDLIRLDMVRRRRELLG